MSDVQLRKKVQLKQKQEVTSVTLKRKGEAATVVTLKTKKSDDAAIVGTAATAAATAAAVSAKAASNATAAGTASTLAANVAGVGAKPAVDSAKAANGATGAGTPGKTGDSQKAGTTGTSGTGNDGKKGGKAWAWILGVVAVAGLSFGGYKLATNNSDNDKSSLLADNNTEVVDGQENTTTGENSITEPSTGSTSEANSESATGANGSESTAVADIGAANGVQNPSTASKSENSNGTSSNGNSSNNNVANTSGSNTNSNGVVEGSTNSASVSKVNSESNSSSNGHVYSNGTVQSSTGSVKNATPPTVSSSKVTKPAIVSSVSDNQAFCLFAFDSSVVGESDALDKLATSAKNSGKKIVVNAYADEVGTNEYNLVLSQRRANAVKDYFIKRGVDAAVITALGKGESTQYATMAENRRADITIQ